MRQTMVDAFRNDRFFSTFASTKSLMRHRSSQRLKNVAASLYGPGPCDTVKAVDPGPYVGAPPKEIRLAETTTVLKDESPEQAVRTIICREVVPGPKKDRWHPLFTTTASDPYEVLTMYRPRQCHEQSYRVGVHDLSLDAAPCAYDKESPDPQRPRFQRGPLQMIGWLVALVYNAVADCASELAGDFVGSHVGTLR